MSADMTPEKVKALEKEYKGYLENKDNILYEYHKIFNNILARLPETGILSYTNSDGLVRGELVCSDGSVYYTWYATENLLGYCIYGAISGLFGSPERRDKWTTAILFGVDIREKFVDMVNISIETIEKVSEEWDICIY